MGLQCSILGHAFEPAGVEREREQEGDEVVTTERELERCRRCGTERVVSESTEVTAVVDGEAVGLENDTAVDIEADPDVETGETAESDPTGDAMSGMVDRAGIDAGEESTADPDGPIASSGADDAVTEIDDAADPASTGGELIESASPEPNDESVDDEPPDPDSEDAEILTDDADPDRDPGEWPDDPDDEDDTERVVETDATVEAPEDESLSGITVPEGEIVCPECGFRVEAHSGYRDGDSCPECNAWLEAERNQ
jgi:DNA-directed RNA polymerase subunit RPC12/RpoP